MKLKIRVTEEFLWKLYESLETLGEAYRMAAPPRSFNDVMYPEWSELRRLYKKRKRTRSFGQFVSYLKKQGYIKIPSGESVGRIELTRKGMQKALRGKAKGQTLRPRKDRKMIMLMFDIPTEQEEVRTAFRDALGLLDFQMLQKSVWVSDKDVLEEAERLVREYNLHLCVNMFIIEKIRVQWNRSFPCCPSHGIHVVSRRIRAVAGDCTRGAAPARGLVSGNGIGPGLSTDARSFVPCEN